MKKLFLSITLLVLSSSVMAKSTLQELTERQNFLTELLIRIQTETVLNHESNLRIRGCLNSNNRSQDCQIARSQVFAPFPEVVRQARLHLALGYRDGIFAGSFTRINSGLNTLKTYKDIKWTRLTSQEEGIAQGLMNKYISEARAEAAKNPNIGRSGPKHDRFVGLAVREKRLAHLQLYKDLISQIVLLQYVSEDRVNSQILGDAFASLVDRSTKEINTITKAARIAENWVKTKKSCAETVDYQLSHPTGDAMFIMSPCVQTPGALLSLLDYRAAVDGILIDYPQYSAILKSLQSERTARSILTGAMLALPTMAICIMAPPLIAIPVGAAAGGLALLNEQNNYNKIRRRELSKVVNPAGNVDWEALKMGRLSRNISAALVPFFGAGKYVSPLFRNAASPAARYVTGMMKFKYIRYAK